MPQVVEFPPIGNDQRGALAALVRVAKETPAKGEPFKDLRNRLRAAKLWDKERPATILRFLGVGGATITPSMFMQALAAAANEDDTAIVVLDRMWNLNPVLGKTVVDLVTQRAYHKDEIYKHLNSAAFTGKLPSRPGLETWIQIALLLWFVLLGVVYGLLYPALRKAADGDESSEPRVPMFTGIVHLLLVLLIIDMVWKPGL